MDGARRELLSGPALAEDGHRQRGRERPGAADPAPDRARDRAPGARQGRRRVRRRSLDAQLLRPRPDPRSGGDVRSRDPRAVQPRAVGRAQILEQPAAALRVQPAMEPGDEAIVEHHLVGGVGPHESVPCNAMTPPAKWSASGCAGSGSRGASAVTRSESVRGWLRHAPTVAGGTGGEHPPPDGETALSSRRHALGGPAPPEVRVPQRRLPRRRAPARARGDPRHRHLPSAGGDLGRGAPRAPLSRRGGGRGRAGARAWRSESRWRSSEWTT